jgi:hypothetical protein
MIEELRFSRIEDKMDILIQKATEHSVKLDECMQQLPRLQTDIIEQKEKLDRFKVYGLIGLIALFSSTEISKSGFLSIIKLFTG